MSTVHITLYRQDKLYKLFILDETYIELYLRNFVYQKALLRTFHTSFLTAQ